jgi:hypothetical protein
MQTVSSSGGRPTSVTVICYLGIVVSALALLLLPGQLVLAGKMPVYFISFFANALIHIGFIIACVLMLLANKNGRLLYHVVSVCWLLESIFEFVLVYMVTGVDHFLRYAAISSEQVTNVVTYEMFSGLIFIIALLSLTLFNVLLYINRKIDYWKI